MKRRDLTVKRVIFGVLFVLMIFGVEDYLEAVVREKKTVPQNQMKLISGKTALVQPNAGKSKTHMPGECIIKFKDTAILGDVADYLLEVGQSSLKRSPVTLISTN